MVAGVRFEKLYSRFRPTRNDPQQIMYHSRPAGDIPGSRTSERAPPLGSSMQTEVISQRVILSRGRRAFHSIAVLGQLGRDRTKARLFYEHTEHR